MKLYEFLNRLWDKEASREEARFKRPAQIAKGRRILKRCAYHVDHLVGDGVFGSEAVMPALAFLLGRSLHAWCIKPNPEGLGRLAQVLTEDQGEADWLVGHAIYGQVLAQATYYFNQPRRLPSRLGKRDPDCPQRDPSLEIEIGPAADDFLRSL